MSLALYDTWSRAVRPFAPIQPGHLACAAALSSVAPDRRIFEDPTDLLLPFMRGCEALKAEGISVECLTPSDSSVASVPSRGN
jgi:hypothetical protein